MTILSPPHWRGWRHHLAQALFAVTLTSCSLAILGLAFILLGGFSVNWGYDRSERARLDVRSIGNALRLYRTKNGRYPTTEEGLRALVSIQALETVPRDPWNFEYHYVLRGSTPIVWSYGADGVAGGEGMDADIYNLTSPSP